jgi:hypothetical protein
MKRWQTLILLLVVAFIPYASALFTGQNLGPTEHIQTMVTPDAPKPDYGWDILQADGVLQFLPWRDLVFDAWRHGEAPMMNPYQLAGQPLTANSQSGGFYPLHILFAFAPGSTGFKIILLGILHLFIAGTGLFYLLRNLKVSEAGSLIGATAFALSQFMVAWAPLASVPTTVAWIPWILAGILCENRKVGFLQVSLATAMMLLAGHLQFAFYGLFAALLISLLAIVKSRKGAALVPLLAIGVGAIVAFPQISLVLKNSQTSHRRNIPDEKGYEGYQKGILAPYEALSFISPKLLGDPSVKTVDLNDSNVPTGYWSMLVKQGANPAECALWISPIALTLALFGLFVNKKKGCDQPTIVPALIIVLLGVLLAFGSPLNRLLFFHFPGWSATGSAGRAHMLIVLGLCVLGGIGFDRFQTKNDGTKKWMSIALVPLVLLGLGLNIINMLSGMLGHPGDDTLTKIISITTKPHLAGFAVSALVGSAFLLLLASKKLPSFAMIPASLVALSLVGQHPLAGKPLEVPRPNIGEQDRALFVSRNWNMAKTPTAVMPPNLASLIRVHDLFGYDSILDKGFVEKLTGALGARPAPDENGNMMQARLKDGELYSADVTAQLSKLGVSVIDRKNPDSIITNSRIIAINNTATKDGHAEITYDGYDHQDVKIAEGTTSVLLRDRYFDGMSTSTSNATLKNEEGWRLIETNGKETTVRIDYPGRSNYIGVIIGIVFLLIGYINTFRKHEPDSVNA